MKRFLAVLALFAVLIPASAFAASSEMYFTNMTGASVKANLFMRWDTLSSGNLIQSTENMKFTGASGGFMHTVQAGVRYFQDNIKFTGTNAATMVVTGNVVRVGRRVLDVAPFKKRAGIIHRGPASFTMFVPYSSIPATGKFNRLKITGAVKVTKIRGRNNKGVVLMSLQPSSVVYNTYTTGSVLTTQIRGGDVKVNPTGTAFKDMSGLSLP